MMSITAEAVALNAPVAKFAHPVNASAPLASQIAPVSVATSKPISTTAALAPINAHLVNSALMACVFSVAPVVKPLAPAPV
jgi:hypothetical protein